ncbi:biopolymer transport protein ExbB [Methylohalomonas lacus]|uniref:Biopolymer transport protein ExbB n=1 Tax=Methylohalomonas lacus TaxID=398773 RepID=A0AAE3L3Q7_9GAMM|nr:MotA/TolQ/ExbB proton channel family protein [Methylohalomonas lacus]MCS3902558.1 biopolymer transport protein ExbB [Methylohalomonas lacus]
MKKQTLTLLLGLCGWLATAPAQAQSLDQLVEQVRQESATEKREFNQRLEEFRNARDEQQQMLEQARAELAALEGESESLREEFESNAENIKAQEAQLKERMGYLDELHGVIRQIAGDIQASLENSLVSAQIPDRAEFVEQLATSEELPSLDEIRRLWQMTLDEIAAAGAVTQFNAPVINLQGEKQQRQVTRIGTFVALADGKYLRYLEDGGKLVEPQRQPSNRYLAQARALESAEDGMHPVAIDPTRGSLLALLVQSPDLTTRIQQGGIVAYVILALALIGLLVAIERFFVLSSAYRKVRRQLRDKSPGNNPLGRIMQVYFDNKHVDTDTLGHKLDESILREINPLQRGLGTIAILAAVTPLLGLLGTVTGIIETFQSITLFGTGDPKLMSAGISEALVTTALGLLAAIPLLLIHSFLSSKSNAIIQILDQQSAAYVAVLAEGEHKAATGK